MKINDPERIRRLVPRWRSFVTSASAGELGSFEMPNLSTTSEVDDTLLHLIEDWKKLKSVEAASELVSCGVVTGSTKEVVEAAEFLVSGNEDVASVIVDISKNLLGETWEREDFRIDPTGELVALYRTVAALKQRVRVNPRNAIAWVELSRAYLTLSQEKRASRAMRIALAVAPSNRFVLRCAARLFVHQRVPDQALSELRRNRRTPRDPWLLAAEISLSEVAGSSSKFLKIASKSIEKKELAPWHVSELCGSLATQVSASGAHKKARRLFGLALRDPTENVLSQLHWEHSVGRNVEVQSEVSRILTAPEALAHHYREKMEWVRCLEQCDKWWGMEPFSGAPLRMASFVSLVALNDGHRGLRYLKKYVRLHPHEMLVHNDMAVALCFIGRLDDADSSIRRAILAQPHQIPSVENTATQGLIAYRRGDVEAARALYLQAIKVAHELGNQFLKTSAIWHMLQEEARIGSTGLRELVAPLAKQAEAIFKGSFEQKALVNRVRQDLDKIIPGSSGVSEFPVEFRGLYMPD